MRRHAQPASLMSDEVLQKRHSAAVLGLLDRHFCALQPLWETILLMPGPLQKKIQFEVRCLHHISAPNGNRGGGNGKIFGASIGYCSFACMTLQHILLKFSAFKSVK